jgi:hypothetical protein
MPNMLFRQSTKPAQCQLKTHNHIFNFRFNRKHGHVGHDCLRDPTQPTGHRMNNELMAQLTNGIFSTIIVLFFTAIISMLIGYRIVAKRLAQKGMKKGDAKAIGQATASLLFLLIAGIYFKFLYLG